MTPSEFRIVRRLARHAMRAAKKLPEGDETARDVRHCVFLLQVELAGEADEAAERIHKIYALSEWYDHGRSGVPCKCTSQQGE